MAVPIGQSRSISRLRGPRPFRGKSAASFPGNLLHAAARPSLPPLARGTFPESNLREDRQALAPTLASQLRPQAHSEYRWYPWRPTSPPARTTHQFHETRRLSPHSLARPGENRMSPPPTFDAPL